MNHRELKVYRVLACLLACLFGSEVGHAELPGPPMDGAMSAADIASLPREVAPDFRNVKNYDWKSVEVDKGLAYGYVMKGHSNCVSLGLNQPGQMGLGGGVDTDKSDMFVIGDPCKKAEKLLRENEGLEIAPSIADSCDFAQGWYPIMILFSGVKLIRVGFDAGIGREMHMVRQLEDGRLVEIAGPYRPIAYAKPDGRILTSFAEYASIVRDKGYPVTCPVWCVRRASVHAALQPPSPEPAFDFGSLRSPRTWTAVTLGSEEGRRVVKRGIACGPYRQRIDLLVYVPAGWYGALIPGARTGLGAATLEVVSNLEGSTEGLSFSGVNLTLAGAIAGPGTLSFDRFYDAQGQEGMGPIDPRTRQRMAPNIDPRGGVRLVALAPLGDGWLSARLEGTTACPRELILAPTAQIRGTPPSAWPPRTPAAARPGS